MCSPSWPFSPWVWCAVPPVCARFSQSGPRMPEGHGCSPAASTRMSVLQTSSHPRPKSPSHTLILRQFRILHTVLGSKRNQIPHQLYLNLRWFSSYRQHTALSTYRTLHLQWAYSVHSHLAKRVMVKNTEPRHQQISFLYLVCIVLENLSICPYLLWRRSGCVKEALNESIFQFSLVKCSCGSWSTSQPSFSSTFLSSGYHHGLSIHICSYRGLQSYKLVPYNRCSLRKSSFNF